MVLTIFLSLDEWSDYRYAPARRIVAEKCPKTFVGIRNGLGARGIKSLQDRNSLGFWAASMEVSDRRSILDFEARKGVRDAGVSQGPLSGGCDVLKIRDCSIRNQPYQSICFDTDRP